MVTGEMVALSVRGSAIQEAGLGTDTLASPSTRRTPSPSPKSPSPSLRARSTLQSTRSSRSGLSGSRSARSWTWTAGERRSRLSGRTLRTCERARLRRSDLNVCGFRRRGLGAATLFVAALEKETHGKVREPYSVRERVYLLRV